MREQVVEQTQAPRFPDLTGRVAVCTQHRHAGQWSRGLMSDEDPGPAEKASNWNLPFFSYKPDQEKDEFYCGCWGWD